MNRDQNFDKNFTSRGEGYHRYTNILYIPISKVKVKENFFIYINTY